MRAASLRFARIVLVLCTVVLPASAVDATAQGLATDSIRPPAAGRIQRLTLRDGSQLMGKVVSVESDQVRFQSAIGVTTIPIASIARIREEDEGRTVDGVYWFPNPNQTRLLFAPTGRQLKRGEGYFSDYWVFFPGLSVGVSDMVTFGGGMSIFPGVSLGDQLMYFTPKVGVVQGPTFNAAVGMLAIAVPTDDNDTAGILYGVGTWGKPDASVTAGLGYGFVNSDLASSPVVMFGAEGRAAPRLSLVTENYLFPGGDFMWTGGLRFMGQGMTVDLAGGGVAGFCCFPFLGFVWKW